jgi:hypothetical protein
MMGLRPSALAALEATGIASDLVARLHDEEHNKLIN